MSDDFRCSECPYSWCFECEINPVCHKCVPGVECSNLKEKTEEKLRQTRMDMEE